MEMRFLWHCLHQLWHFLREVSGDDAYERYLALYIANQEKHQHAVPPMSREEFCKVWQQQKWDGIKRCC